MFSGIVEGTGKVQQIEKIKGGARLVIKLPSSIRLNLGGSLAINGCCLTSAAKKKGLFEADLSYETLRVTNLGNLRCGSLVNLERPLKLNGLLGGHLVQGHVDGVGKIAGLKRKGDDYEIRVKFPQSLRRYMIPKGSVTIDGVSMTVNDLKKTQLTLVVIPHTWKMTNFRLYKVGSPVNLEADMVGKYIVSFLKGYQQ